MVLEIMRIHSTNIQEIIAKIIFINLWNPIKMKIIISTLKNIIMEGIYQIFKITTIKIIINLL